jgi:hypothetical protein
MFRKEAHEYTGLYREVLSSCGDIYAQQSDVEI